ncbi:hypothetical protein [Gracilibacillus timonensis]|uniref:hypothetical protein n=1 Tax=Gracilibacillus timonensis TaxID=1816696 RepID=UPI000824FB81|nr:hypothetical protein [Gracilibacillus timonensis]
MQYIEAIKSLNKKYYLTPFLLLIYAMIFLQIWEHWSRFITFDSKDAMDYIIFIVSLFKVNSLFFIQILFYPHANFFIQTTKIYKKIFGTAWGKIKSGFSIYTNIGENIPDDIYMRGSSGTRYTVSSGYKTKRERVSEARGVYLYYLVMKFIFKDFILRLFTHFGVFIISPILFLIAIPLLYRNETLEYTEK